MNRRGFISLMVGAAGAPLVPWRGLIEPLISLPPRAKLWAWPGGHYWYDNATFSNRLNPNATLTQASLERMLVELQNHFTDTHAWVITPTQLVVSPQIKRLIDTDPDVRKAAEIVLGHKL